LQCCRIRCPRTRSEATAGFDTASAATVRCPRTRSEATHHAGSAPLRDVASALGRCPSPLDSRVQPVYTSFTVFAPRLSLAPVGMAQQQAIPDSWRRGGCTTSTGRSCDEPRCRDSRAARWTLDAARLTPRAVPWVAEGARRTPRDLRSGAFVRSGRWMTLTRAALGALRWGEPPPGQREWHVCGPA
jgi:hypothetical protein